MSTFALTGTDPSAIIDAVNHLLATQGQGGNNGGSTSGNVLTANTTTGQITSGGIVVSYLYRWIQVRYADSADGGTGFSDSPTNKAYYGLYNTVAKNPGDVTNPANYQWTRATGGFSTNKFLWYATYGGGQVAWFVGTAAPSSSYAQVINPPTTDYDLVDLNFVTATATLPLVTPIIYQRGNTTPATPTGGTYDFSTLTLTPPTGWYNSIPAGNLPCYTSQNQFQAVPAGTPVGPSLAWTTPIVTSTYGTPGSNGISSVNYNVFQSGNVSPGTPSGGYYNFATSTGTPPAGGWSNTPISANGAPIWASTATISSSNPTANVSIGSNWTPTFQYTGAGGAQGTRGPIPMAYVLTPSNPIGASTVQLSAWFGASRNNVVAPIGMGTPPISNDTACFTDATNSANNVVYTFDSLTNTWTAVQGTVVNGNVFVTGSVNAQAMNANDVYALTMRGGTVTPGVNSGFGFWLTATPTGNAAAGDAYMGGNVFIGGNLTVQGLISSSSNVGNVPTLNSNTVQTTTIVNGTISGGTAGTAGTDASPNVITSPAQNQFYITDMYTDITTDIPNQPVYIWSQLATTVAFSGLSAGEVAEFDTFLIRQNNTTMVTDIVTALYYNIGGVSTQDVFPNFNGFVDIAPTAGSYTYGVAYFWFMVTGTATITSITTNNRNILVQTLKR